MSFEIYCSDLVYYEHKSKLKNIFNSFGLKWKSDKSGWFNRGNSVVKSGLDNSDRLLVVSGSSDFVETVKSISKLFFIEERPEAKQKGHSLEKFILKRVDEERVRAELFGYNLKVVEYFTINRIIDLNS